MAKQTVKITQRLNPCMCGCHGQDPQHRQHTKRAVRHYAAFDLVLPMASGWVVLACGTYAHPEGERVCYLVGYAIDGELRGQGSWYAARAWYGNK